MSQMPAPAPPNAPALAALQRAYRDAVYRHQAREAAWREKQREAEQAAADMAAAAAECESLNAAITLVSRL